MIDCILLFDDADWRKSLLPLVAIRPVSELRVGIFTISKKWVSHAESVPVGYLTVGHLQEKYPASRPRAGVKVIVRGNIIPDEQLIAQLHRLPVGAVLVQDSVWIACKMPVEQAFDEAHVCQMDIVRLEGALQQITYPEDVFVLNADEIAADLRIIRQQSRTYDLPAGNTAYGDAIFLASPNTFKGVSLNAETGPIYIGAGAQLEEGIYIKGPVAIGEGARVKTGSRLYPNVSVGPGSTVCGEINNTVIWGNSAKGHDGYLGCAVIGEGCNLGAGSSNSNLRNDWKPVSLFDYQTQAMRNTGLLKCGLVMGDQAMVAINSSFTTGTVIGVGAQMALSGFIPKFVPDFAWLTDSAKTTYQLDKFLAMLARRSGGKINTMNPMDSRIFEQYYQQTAELRNEYLHHLSK